MEKIKGKNFSTIITKGDVTHAKYMKLFNERSPWLKMLDKITEENQKDSEGPAYEPMRKGYGNEKENA